MVSVPLLSRDQVTLLPFRPQLPDATVAAPALPHIRLNAMARASRRASGCFKRDFMIFLLN